MGVNNPVERSFQGYLNFVHDIPVAFRAAYIRSFQSYEDDVNKGSWHSCQL